MRITSDKADPRSLHEADIALARAAQSGDRVAIDRFIERMHCVPRMLAAKNTQLGAPLGREELEDVAQETLIAVWRKLALYNGIAALETWSYRFGYLELLRRLRGRRARPELFADVDAQPETVPAAPAPPSSVDFEHVYVSLDALDSEESQIVHLKHFEELTFEAIGTRLGLSPNTAKTRYYRGVRKLRDRLAQNTPERGRRARS